MNAQEVTSAQSNFQVELEKFSRDPSKTDVFDKALEALNKVLADFVKGPSESSDTPPTPESAAEQPPPSNASEPPPADNGTQDQPEGSASSENAAPLSAEAQSGANSPETSLEIAEQYISQLQKDFGLTREQAMGVVANLWHESAGMNSGINQGGVIGAPSGNNADDNANGYGIAQWGGVRKEGLIKYANDNGLDPSSQAANYGFLKQELSGEYKAAIDAVKDTTSAEEATQVFSSTYEKPSDPQMASRLEILDRFS